MAQRVHLAECSVSMRDAHNANHASMSSGFVHYDGPEYQPDPVGAPPRCPVMLVGGAVAPASTAEAVQFLLDCKAFLNEHFSYADEVIGDHIYAHKVVDTARIITALMSPWSTMEAAMLEAARLLVNDLGTQYEHHRLNSGGVWHSSVDAINTLAGPITFSALEWTAKAGAERTNLLKALFSDHVVKTPGAHSAADSGNVISAANVTYTVGSGVDWGQWITLLTELRTKMISHVGTGVHAIVDNVNIVTLPVPAPPLGTYDLPNEILTKFNLHVADGAIHPTTDVASQTSITSVSSLSDLLGASIELYGKVRGHVVKAPVSRAVRRIV